MQRLHDQCVVMISQDSFYRGLTEAELANVQGAFRSLAPSWRRESRCNGTVCVFASADYNFDSPDAFDVEALVDCLAMLKVGQSLVGRVPGDSGPAY